MKHAIPPSPGGSSAAPSPTSRRGPLWPWFQVIALLLALAVGTGALSLAYRRYMRAAYPVPTEYADLIETGAADHGFDPSLIYAIIRTESSFKPDAVSRAGAVGLMQVTRPAFLWVLQRVHGNEERDMNILYDPATNIAFGLDCLSLLRELFPDSPDETLLAAYNAGQGNVQDWLDDEAYSDDGLTLKTMPIGETRWYVKKVTEAQALYRELYDLK